MQGFKVLMLLAVLVAVLGLACAAPADESLAPQPVLEQLPAMLVRSGPTQLDRVARQCSNSACASLCRSLGWSTGLCLDAEWCLCYN